jgi:hypothetical protein
VKSKYLVLAGLLSATSLHAGAAPIPAPLPTAKPGASAPVTLAATVTTQAAPVVAGTTTVTTTTKSTAVRITNREILTAMVPTQITSVTGYSLVRLTKPDGTSFAATGQLYAVKSGAPAVLVPVNLLTDLTITGSTTTGTVAVTATPAPSVTVTNLSGNVFGTVGVQNGTSTFGGTQTQKSASLKLGTTTTQVVNRGESVSFQGKISALKLVSGTFKVQGSKPGNLSTYLP